MEKSPHIAANIYAHHVDMGVNSSSAAEGGAIDFYDATRIEEIARFP